MSLDLSDDEIHGLIAYARDKFGDEPYPLKKPYVPSLVLQRKNKRRR